VFAPMINDVWKLELTLPYDSDEKYKTVQNDRLIRVTDLDAVSEQSSTQIFRIYDYKKESSSVYVLAYPVALDARFEAIADHLDLRNKSASDAIAVINNMAAKYTVTTDLTTTNTAEYDNVNMIEALNGENGFVQKWGGDICYDNYNIKVREALGNQNSNFDIRYGKNIQAMSIEEDTSVDVGSSSKQARAKRAIKKHGYYKLPPFLRAHLYFIYRYYFRLGFLDGKEGKIYTFLQAYWYRFLVDAKLYECTKYGISPDEQKDLKN
jgi:hypothetical protein